MYLYIIGRLQYGTYCWLKIFYNTKYETNYFNIKLYKLIISLVLKYSTMVNKLLK